MADLAATKDWVPIVHGIDNGDPLNATELTAPETALTKRTAYLREHTPSARAVTDEPIPLQAGVIAGATVDDTSGALIATWNYLAVGGGSELWTQRSVTAAFWLSFPIPYRPGATLTGAKVRIAGGSAYSGNANHSDLPATKPILVLVETDLATGACTVLGNTTDPSANVGAYNAVHEITVTGSFVMVTGKRYSIHLYGETGTNSEAFGLCLFNVAYSSGAPANETL